VNYWLYNNGCYGYPSSSHIIENKNMLCELDADFKPIADSFVLVDEQMDIPKYEGDVFSRGLEDVRLYKPATASDYGVKFIATNVDYSPNGKNNMVIGDYSLEQHTISNVQVVLPPVESWCEKNWIPIFRGVGEDLFIYKWSPMEIGRINPDTGTLEIVMAHMVNAPYFNKVRGSTTFVEREDGLLGVVHFSEDHNPRHYYHILVLLEKESLRPLKYSNCFCFKSLGVEFCIGFTDELADEYVFWTSQMDREPMTVFINNHKCYIHNYRKWNEDSNSRADVKLGSDVKKMRLYLMQKLKVFSRYCHNSDFHLHDLNIQSILPFQKYVVFVEMLHQLEKSH
jgi:hypothetical protein